MTNRHAKPTAAALAERTYRKVLALRTTLLNQMAHIRLDLAAERREDREHMKTLIDHCARLLREQETLQRQLYAVRELKDSAQYGQRDSKLFESNVGGLDWSKYTPKPATHEAFIAGKCAWADKHRINERCIHCGEIQIAPENYDANARDFGTPNVYEKMAADIFNAPWQRDPVFWCDQHLSYCVKISDRCHRLAHANSCSNQNVLRPEGMFEGAEECACRHWGPI